MLIRMKLQNRLLLVLFLLTGVSTAAVTGAAIYYFSEKIKQEALSNLQRHGQVAMLVYREHLKQNRERVIHLANDPALLNFTFFNIGQKLRDYLDNALARGGPDYLATYDREGRLLAESAGFEHFALPADLCPPAPDSLSERVRRRLEPMALTEILPTAQGTLLSLGAAAPLFTRRGELAGVVLARTILNANSELIAEMEHFFPGAAALFYQGKRLADNPGKLSVPPPRDIQAHGLASGETEIFQAAIRADGQLTHYLAVTGMENQAGLILGIGLSAEPYVITLRQAMKWLLAVMAVCLLLALIMAFLLARGILVPLRHLLQGVKRVSAGELEYTLKCSGRDELATLAQSFNLMAEALRHSVRNLEKTVDTLSRAGNALVVEKNLDILLELFVSEARGFTEAGQALLYLMEDEGLSLKIRQGDIPPPEKTPEQIERVVLHKESLWLDKKDNSLLVIPLLDHFNHCIGVLQLGALPPRWREKTRERKEQLSIIGALAGQAAVAVENARIHTRLQRQKATFELFVPKEFLFYLGQRQPEDIKVGDAAQAEMSVLFSDIRNFTTLAENMPPEQIFEFLNRYLGHIGPRITSHGGFIDKYIGDAIMALFPGTQVSSADDAVAAALGMARALRRFNAGNAEHPPLTIGLGIHTGILSLGTMGFEQRLESTVVGDTVNLASRVESLTKLYGITLGITSATLEQLKNRDNLLIREVDRVQVKGKQMASTIYDVFSADPQERQKRKQETLDAFYRALELYRQRDWSAAARLFREIQAHDPEDKLMEIYLRRCAELQGNPPTESWRGITRLDEK